ncbi:MAG TPA: CHAP domain-containing protein [Bacteroidia bacterium]|nr:CHAP domain-containing protein [Bacteroidia bacterium]
MKKSLVLFLILLLVGFVAYKVAKKVNLNTNYKVGQPLDSLNHVIVYYNGGVDNNAGRNMAPDGYNIGIKYQCVEFVKRYYYQYLNHKMPDTHGHAKNFFNDALADSTLNPARNLMQYTNGSKAKPMPNDLLVFSGSLFNRYGHVAIISSVTQNQIEIIQQNPGPFGTSRETISLINSNNKWTIDNSRVLGWLRKQ